MLRVNFFKFLWPRFTRRVVLTSTLSYRLGVTQLIKVTGQCGTMSSSITKLTAITYRSPYQHKPVILITGILTFLGLQEKTPEEKESELIMTIKRGILLIQKEEFNKAEQMLHIALRLAQQQANEDGITYVYDVMANLAFDTEQYLKAEKLFITVLQRIIAGGLLPTDNKVIHISLKLAKIYEKTKDHNKAEEGYKYCIQHLEKEVSNTEASEDTLTLWAMAADWYAGYLMSLNRAKDALPYFQKAYDMCVKMHGKDHEQSVILMNDLGTVASVMGDLETAVTYLREGADIGKSLTSMPLLGSIYVNLGQVYLQKMMYAESKRACETGLRYAKEYEDKDGMHEAQECLSKLRQVYS